MSLIMLQILMSHIKTHNHLLEGICVMEMDTENNTLIILKE